MNLNPFKRKSKFRQMIDAIESNDALKSAAITAAESAVAGATSKQQAEKVAKALKSLDSSKMSKPSKPLKGKAKTGLAVAAGTAAVIGASASVSSARRKEKQAA